MKVDYTLPGLLPESALAARADVEYEEQNPPFGAQLQRLRAPATADWRAILRLGLTPPGFGSLSAPPVPQGVTLRNASAQRAWWRNLLHRHSSNPARSQPAIDDMLNLLQEAQRREDRIFARHFAEDETE